MRKLLPVLFILVLLVLGGLGYKLWEQQQNLEISQEEKATLERQLREEQAERERMERERLSQLDKAMGQEAERQRIALQQAEAARLAEERAKIIEAEKERNIAELNQRLRKEAEDRQAIERQLELLEKERSTLATAKAEAEAKAKELAEQRNVDRTATEQALAAVAQQETEMRRVEERQQALDLMFAEAEKRQLTTEQEIIDTGGIIDPALKQVRSINYKRREHFYLQQQMATQ